MDPARPLGLCLTRSTRHSLQPAGDTRLASPTSHPRRRTLGAYLILIGVKSMAFASTLPPADTCSTACFGPAPAPLGAGIDTTTVAL